MASAPVTAILTPGRRERGARDPFADDRQGVGRRQASMPVSVVDSHHPASMRARKMIGAATVRAPRGLFRVATTYFPTPGVRAAQQTHECASCTPPIRTFTVGAGISPAQPSSFCEGGSRTITAGSDFHRPRSTRVPLCHRTGAPREAYPLEKKRGGRMGPRPIRPYRCALSAYARWRVRAAPRPRGGRLPRGTPRNPRRSCRHPASAARSMVAREMPPSTWIETCEPGGVNRGARALNLRDHLLDEGLSAEIPARPS